MIRTIWISLLGKIVSDDIIAGLFLEKLVKRHAKECNISLTNDTTGEVIFCHCDVTRRSDL